MSPLRRQRLIGFLLLASVAAIFLPMVLDGEGYRQRQLDTDIPPVPKAPDWVDLKPKNKPHPPSIEVAEPRPQPAATAVAEPLAEPEPGLSVRREEPVLDTQGVTVAWTLQLASFKDRDNADKLKQRLLKAGYKAYIRQKQDLSKVFVGPDLQRVEMEKLRDRLKKEFKLDGLVLRFTTG